jgi:hypothetical protein
MVRFSVDYSFDYLTFAAPIPGTKPRTFAIVQPFGLLEWTCILASAFFVAAVIFGVANVEKRILRVNMHPWDEPLSALRLAV